MSELLLLRREVAPVLVGWLDLDTDPLDDGQTIAIQTNDLLGVVREKPDATDPEVSCSNQIFRH